LQFVLLPSNDCGLEPDDSTEAPCGENNPFREDGLKFSTWSQVLHQPAPQILKISRIFVWQDDLPR
jgi:hypothetical protein